MSNQGLLENRTKGHQSLSEKEPKTTPSFQSLLDVLSSIIAEEYITIAKQNPEVFSGEVNK